MSLKSVSVVCATCNDIVDLTIELNDKDDRLYYCDKCKNCVLKVENIKPNKIFPIILLSLLIGTGTGAGYVYEKRSEEKEIVKQACIYNLSSNNLFGSNKNLNDILESCDCVTERYLAVENKINPKHEFRKLLQDCSNGW